MRARAFFALLHAVLAGALIAFAVTAVVRGDLFWVAADLLIAALNLFCACGILRADFTDTPLSGERAR